MSVIGISTGHPNRKGQRMTPRPRLSAASRCSFPSRCTLPSIQWSTASGVEETIACTSAIFHTKLRRYSRRNCLKDRDARGNAGNKRTTLRAWSALLAVALFQSILASAKDTCRRTEKGKYLRHRRIVVFLIWKRNRNLNSEDAVSRRLQAICCPSTDATSSARDTASTKTPRSTPA